ncbi:hypothetical protein APHAL10511_005061 [Amanita phalloides]|nr:hypothetical protein APHAL10511_005061 [Amanita phalloides]
MAHIPLFSSLAMVVNANSKLQSFMRDHKTSATPRIKMFFKLVSELMDEIFFVPRGFHSRLDDLLSLQVPSQPHPVVGATSIGAVSGIPTPTGHGFRQPSNSVDLMEELNAPEQPDDDDGLTPSEFRPLAQQVRDPELGPRDRANAVSMLIYGVHVKAWWTPHWSVLEDLLDVLTMTVQTAQLFKGTHIRDKLSQMLSRQKDFNEAVETKFVVFEKRVFQ